MTERNHQYSIGSIVLIGLFALLPAGVYAQDCEPAKQRIYHITEAQPDPDSLQTLLNLAAAVRTCEGDVALALELWLLNNEVFALDGLQRYDEAATLIDHFFASYADEAPDRYLAWFYNWRAHFNALTGNVVDMVVAYTEAQRYAHALDATDQASVILNGAYAYFETDQYGRTLDLTQQAQALIGTPDTREERIVTARALLLGAEAGLWLGTELPQVREKLNRAVVLYGTLGDTARVSIATTLLGLNHAAEGDTSTALVETARAVGLAQASGVARSRAFTHWRHGKLLRKTGDYAAAEPVLLKAVDAALIAGEFYLEAIYELAQVYEEQGEYDQAARYYQAVVDAPKPKSYAAALDAERKMEAAEVRLMLIESARRHARDQLVIGGLLLALLAVGFVFLLRRRRPSVVDHGSNGVYIPRYMHAGLSLNQLRKRFQKAAKSELVGSRLAYVYAVLYDPDLIMSYIDDTVLQEQIEADRLKNNTALFLCVAKIETVVEQRVFSRDPANTIANHMRPELDKRGWPWPPYPLDWKRYFMQYHMETLFGRARRSTRSGGESGKGGEGEREEGG